LYELLEFRKRRFSLEDAVKVSISVQLVRFGLVISDDLKHETRMNHIAPAPNTNLGVCKLAIIPYLFCKRRMNVTWCVYS
jgi:hypothetical protein